MQSHQDLSKLIADAENGNTLADFILEMLRKASLKKEINEAVSALNPFENKEGSLTLNQIDASNVFNEAGKFIGEDTGGGFLVANENQEIKVTKRSLNFRNSAAIKNLTESQNLSDRDGIIIDAIQSLITNDFIETYSKKVELEQNNLREKRKKITDKKSREKIDAEISLLEQTKSQYHEKITKVSEQALASIGLENLTKIIKYVDRKEWIDKQQGIEQDKQEKDEQKIQALAQEFQEITTALTKLIEKIYSDNLLKAKKNKIDLFYTIFELLGNASNIQKIDEACVAVALIIEENDESTKHIGISVLDELTLFDAEGKFLGAEGNVENTNFLVASNVNNEADREIKIWKDRITYITQDGEETTSQRDGIILNALRFDYVGRYQEKHTNIASKNIENLEKEKIKAGPTSYEGKKIGLQIAKIAEGLRIQTLDANKLFDEAIRIIGLEQIVGVINKSENNVELNKKIYKNNLDLWKAVYIKDNKLWLELFKFLFSLIGTKEIESEINKLFADEPKETRAKVNQALLDFRIKHAHYIQQAQTKLSSQPKAVAIDLNKNVNPVPTEVSEQPQEEIRVLPEAESIKDAETDKINKEKPKDKSISEEKALQKNLQEQSPKLLKKITKAAFPKGTIIPTRIRKLYESPEISKSKVFKAEVTVELLKSLKNLIEENTKNGSWTFEHFKAFRGKTISLTVPKTEFETIDKKYLYGKPEVVDTANVKVNFRVPTNIAAIYEKCNQALIYNAQEKPQKILNAYKKIERIGAEASPSLFAFFRPKPAQELYDALKAGREERLKPKVK